ncbi:hypothetical protein ACFYWO_39940 [Streptomyces sp. NPDC002932]|uniref:hypothetical protein n=1 Tax=Streptomyces sp. NPDC002932 TaxID=3364672 RepID=UPI0036C300E4
MTDSGPGGGVRRRERQTGAPRRHRVPLSFNDAELAVVKAAAGREGMAPASWAGRQVMAIAQEVLVPVSRDAGDVLRELVHARVRLREVVTALRSLNTPAVPSDRVSTAASDTSPGAAPDTSTPASDTASTAAVGRVEVVIDEALRAVSRVDEATLLVMRERRPR